MFSDEGGTQEITAPQKIDSLGHDWGEVDDPEAFGHDWGEWKVTKAASETEEGIEMRTCKNDASHTETRTIQKLDPKEVTYSCTEGSGAKWTKGSKKDASFTFKRSKNDSETFSHFTGIQVDGKDVASSNYTAKAGSVIVKLKPSYMETLTAGKHTLTARFDDGNDVSAEFTVLAAGADSKNNSSTDNASKNTSTSPATGDDSSMALWVCLLAVSLFAMGGIMITRRRKGNR